MIPPLRLLSVASSVCTNCAPLALTLIPKLEQAPTPAPVPTPVPVLVLAPTSVCAPSAMARFPPLIPIYAPPVPVPTPAPTPAPMPPITPIPAPVPIHPAAPALSYPPSLHMPAYPPLPLPAAVLRALHVPYWPTPPGLPICCTTNAKVEDCKAFLAKMKSLSDLLKELKLEEGNDANFVPPNPTDVRAYTNWVRCNGLVHKAIVCSLDSSQYPYVQENTTVSSVWAALQEVHAPLTKAWASSLRSQILLLRMPRELVQGASGQAPHW
ncbi:hypothetical protein RHS01_09600 [Rhizoctonia solani]|uniref:Uncharacterized protein n=1 Tax=Rhizoctonia solani TaxID=456999 RepID=A0A8H7M1C1_9AGAM|nr:hypothetical protein RHS01_09600 [Rhizoctonia solani]